MSVTGTMRQTLGELNPFRYRGYYYDTESGLYYLRSRYYDPEACRFLNADASTDTGNGVLGTNMFSYCENSPIIKIDSNGKLPYFFWDIPAELRDPESGKNARTSDDVLRNVLLVFANPVSTVQKIVVQAAVETAFVLPAVKVPSLPLSVALFRNATIGYGGRLSQDVLDLIVYEVRRSSEMDAYIRNCIANSRYGLIGGGTDFASIEFKSGDLYYAIHWAKVFVSGSLGKDGQWNIHVMLQDTFDFEQWASTGLGSLLNQIGFTLQETSMLTPFTFTVNYWEKRYYQ